MRKGRYRFQMIEEEKLRAWAPSLERLFCTWKSGLDSGFIEEWEFVAAYLVLFVFLHRPQEKWSAHVPVSPSERQRAALDFFQTTAKQELALLVDDERLPCWELCSTWIYGSMKSLRGVPEKVLRSLQAWREEEYQLVVLHRVPSAQELLKLQVEGIRCVTALIQKEEIERPVETGRDVWSFCLHDLLHASHFFGDPINIGAQKYLSHLFLTAWEKTSLAQWLDEDPQFASEFEYVAADMNAHPVYLWMSFYAVVLDFYKRRLGMPTSESLVLDQEEHWQYFWREWIVELIPSSSSIFESFISIPRMARGQQDYTVLQDEMLKAGVSFQC